MIRSDKQYEAAKKQLLSLQQGLTSKSETEAPEAVLQATRGQISELAAEIEKAIKDYEDLQKAQPK